MKRSSLRQQVGQQTPVLIETVTPAGQQNGRAGLGYTPGYHRVRVDLAGNDDLHNQIRAVSILALNETGDTLLAALN